MNEAGGFVWYDYYVCYRDYILDGFGVLPSSVAAFTFLPDAQAFVNADEHTDDYIIIKLFVKYGKEYNGALEASNDSEQ